MARRGPKSPPAANVGKQKASPLSMRDLQKKFAK
jgi:hypothetical protein